MSQFARVLLPRNIKADILEFTPRLSVRALSYRILCHGEIERYLEDRSLEILVAAQSAWEARSHISRTTISILAFSGVSLDRVPETLHPPANKKKSNWDALVKIDYRLGLACRDFNYYLRSQNHGIKEPNILNMMLRIGVTPDQLDEVLIADLNDLGVKRGDAAHGGASGSVQRGVNPRDEFEQMGRILTGLHTLDARLTEILEAAR